MRQAIVFIALVASLALVAAGCGGGSKESSASATVEWANGFCTAVTAWTDSLKQIGEQLAKPSSLSQEGLDQAANDVREATQTLVDDLKGLGAPDTESGQETKDAIDQLATTLDDDLTEIEDTVDGVSGLTGVPAAIASISTTLSSMATAFSSTLQTIENGDVKGELQDAFQPADSCSGLTDSSN